MQTHRPASYESAQNMADGLLVGEISRVSLLREFCVSACVCSRAWRPEASRARLASGWQFGTTQRGGTGGATPSTFSAQRVRPIPLSFWPLTCGAPQPTWRLTLSMVSDGKGLGHTHTSFHAPRAGHQLCRAYRPCVFVRAGRGIELPPNVWDVVFSFLGLILVLQGVFYYVLYVKSERTNRLLLCRRARLCACKHDSDVYPAGQRVAKRRSRYARCTRTTSPKSSTSFHGTQRSHRSAPSC
jgi:hypothetical protein